MRGCKRRDWIGLVSVLLVAGCAESAPPPELRTSSSLQASAADAMPAPQPPPPRPAPVHKASAPATADAVATPSAETPQIGTQGVDRLIGLNETEVETYLGPPMLQEDRAPTKLWVFRSKDCTINVTLYPDVETRQFHALSYEVISDVHTAERTRQCIAEFSSRFSAR